MDLIDLKKILLSFFNHENFSLHPLPLSVTSKNKENCQERVVICKKIEVYQLRYLIEFSRFGGTDTDTKTKTSSASAFFSISI